MHTGIVVQRNVISVNCGSFVSTRYARQNGLSYSKLMHGLKLAGVDINRKMLADLAVNDLNAFNSLATVAKEKVNA